MTQQEFQTRYEYNPSTDCIGEGGFGKVYKAYDTHLNKWVAIKVAEVKTGMEQVRLKKEVEIVSKLQTHPNIANYEACYTFSSFTGEYDFAVLQYYEEGNLQQLIDSGKLNQTQKEALLRQILEGIGFLHNQDIIHRDLKPQNILIAKRNDEYIPKITDFGISKKLDINKSSVFTNSLAGAGTMAYASPEQLLGKTIKKNTDLWSFGVIVCQVFTGKLPFSVGRDGINSEAGRIELYKQIVNGTVSFSNNSIPAKWQQLIKQCIVVDNNLRAAKAEICFSIFNSSQNSQNGATTVIEGKISNTKTTNEEQNLPLKTSDEYYNRALNKIKKNNFSTAILDLNEAIKSNKSNDYYFKRGFCYKQLKKYDEAIFDFTEEIKLFGWNTNCISERAQCYESMNLLNKACDDYLTIVERISDRFYFNKWFELAKKIDKQDIIDFFLKSKKIQLKDERELVLNYSFSKHPYIVLESANEYFKRALFKMDSRNFYSAIKDLNEAIKLNTSKGYYFKRAVCYQKTNQFENAINDYNEELKISGIDKTILFNRANCYKSVGKYKEALADYNEDIRIFGRQLNVIIARGECHELKNDFYEACNDYCAALEANWNNVMFDKWVNLVKKTKIKLQIEKVYNFPTQSLSISNIEIILFAKAQVAYLMNDYEKCIKFIEDISELTISSSDEYYNFCVAKSRENQHFRKIFLKSNFFSKKLKDNDVLNPSKSVLFNFWLLILNASCIFSLLYVISSFFDIRIFEFTIFKKPVFLIGYALFFYFFLISFYMWTITETILNNKYLLYSFLNENNTIKYIERINLSIFPIILIVIGIVVSIFTFTIYTHNESLFEILIGEVILIGLISLLTILPGVVLLNSIWRDKFRKGESLLNKLF